MCMGTGFSSARYNLASRALGDSYRKIDPTLGTAERVEAKAFAQSEVAGSAAAQVPDAQFASPNSPASKRGTNFATGTASLLGG